jgi:transcriptional regulator with XRE-family HTH domain
MSFAENIKKYRTLRGLTQEELAAKVGVSGQAVSKWETNDTLPDTAILPDLADALDVSIDLLFGHKSTSAEAVMPSLFGYITAGDSAKSLDQRTYDILAAAYKASTWRDCGDEPWWNWMPKDPMCRIYLNTDGLNGVMFEHPEFSLCTTVPEPKDGYGLYINERSAAYLAALADPDILACIVTMMKRTPDLPEKCELAVLLRDAGIAAEKEDELYERMSCLGRLFLFSEVEINGRPRRLLSVYPTNAVYFLSIYASAYAATYRGELITGSDGCDRTAPLIR